MKYVSVHRELKDVKEGTSRISVRRKEKGERRTRRRRSNKHIQKEKGEGAP